MQAYTARDRSEGQVVLRGSFLVNGTSDPDGVKGSGFTVVRSDVGTFLLTITNSPAVYCQVDYQSASYVPAAFADGDACPQATIVTTDIEDGTFTILTGQVDSGGLFQTTEVDDSRVDFIIAVRQYASPAS